MDPNQPGSSNPDQTGQTTRTSPAPTLQPGQTSTEAGPAPAKAQSEIGPITYGGPNGPVNHGPDDAETKAAYAAGHPSQGIAAQRAAQQSQQQQGQTTSRTAQPTGVSASTGTQRVRMTRDEGGHTAGQDVDLPADEAQRLISSGAAQAV